MQQQSQEEPCEGVALSASHPLPDLPEASSPSRTSFEPATENEHLFLRTLTWFLGRTESNEIDDKLNPGANTTYNSSCKVKNRFQFVLFDQLEALAVLLTRQHEAISVLPSDKNGRRNFVSRSYSAKASGHFDYIEIDPEEAETFGSVLHLENEKMKPRRSEWALSETDRQRSGQKGENSFVVEFSGAVPGDYPVPSDAAPSEFPSDHGPYLMGHTKARIGDDVFVTDVSFSEHCGNVVDAIKRTHLAEEDEDKSVAARFGLARYVYLSSATLVHSRIARGFTEYSFGKFLTISMNEILDQESSIRGTEPETSRFEETLRGLLEERRTEKSQTAMMNLLVYILPTLGIHHEHLNPNGPESLLNRKVLYDEQGRVMFHTLVVAIMQKLRESTTKLVRAKRDAMAAQVDVNNGVDIPSRVLEELASNVSYYVEMTTNAFEALRLLRMNFEWVLYVHLAWIAGIFGVVDQSFPAEQDAPDGLDGLREDISDPDWALSCLSWMRLLCQQEMSMIKLRYPTSHVTRRDRILSMHILNAEVFHLSLTPALCQSRMMPLRECLRNIKAMDDLDERHTSQAIEAMVQWLTSQRGDLGVAGLDQVHFRGCMHTEALQMLLVYLIIHQENKSGTAVAGKPAPQTGSDISYMPRHIWSSKLAPLSEIFRNQPLMMSTNRAFCAGCRVVANQVLASFNGGDNNFMHRASRYAWKEMELPLWTPSNIVQAFIEKASEEAATRMRQFLDQAGFGDGSSELFGQEETSSTSLANSTDAGLAHSQPRTGGALDSRTADLNDENHRVGRPSDLCQQGNDSSEQQTHDEEPKMKKDDEQSYGGLSG